MMRLYLVASFTDVTRLALLALPGHPHHTSTSPHLWRASSPPIHPHHPPVTHRRARRQGRSMVSIYCSPHLTAANATLRDRAIPLLPTIPPAPSCRHSSAPLLCTVVSLRPSPTGRCSRLFRVFTPRINQRPHPPRVHSLFESPIRIIVSDAGERARARDREFMIMIQVCN